MKKVTLRPEAADCIVLFGVVLCSALPYLCKLGFYSDDWYGLAALSHSSGRGIGYMLRQAWKGDPSLRPVPVVWGVLEFHLFGLHPLPYHFASSVVLALVAVFLYLALTEIPMGRWSAFGIAVVFGLLPHYCTDRFWISADEAALSMVFALLGLYALLRSLRPEARSLNAWTALAVTALALSFLSYEAPLGLIVASLAALGVRQCIRARLSPSAFRQLAGIVVTTLLLLLLGAIKAHLQSRVTAHFPGQFVHRVGHTVVQAMGFNFWTYGLHLPAVLAAMRRQSAIGATAVCPATIIALLVAAYLWRCLGTAAIPSRRTCRWLIAAGLLVFGLGSFLIFFFDYGGKNFSTAGINNRYVIASALGVPCVLTGILGLASSVLKSPLVRVRVCSVAIGAICGLHCLVLYGIAFYWAGAVPQQSAVLRAVAAGARPLPKGSVLLLDGFCRYFGPAIVFETDWDSTGALQLQTGDDSMTADVISPSLRLDDGAVKTTIYDEPEGNYPYGPHLFVFNLRQHTLTNLPSKEAAAAYLRAANPTQDSGCPAGMEGQGIKVF